MRVQFLGTVGYHPTERRHTTSLLVPELGVAFDAGTGFFRVPPLMVGRHLDVFITHAHLDHISGLTYLLVPLARKELAGVTVHVREPYLTAIREHLFSDLVFPILPDCEFRELTGPVELANGWRVTFQPLARHPGGSTGYRLDGPGGSFAFITDVTADDSYLEFIRGASLLVHECNFDNARAQWSEPTGHSHVDLVTDVARRAGVGKLVLTHFDPLLPDEMPVELDAARRVFRATELARDLMEYEW
jgi:ribonuclease BN (tRNA processing enzyme)